MDISDELEEKILEDIYPTDAQIKLLKKLERLLLQCEKAHIFIWHNYTQLSALNGNVVNDVINPDVYDPKIAGYDIELNGREYGINHSGMASNADDTLGIVLREKYKRKLEVK